MRELAKEALHQGTVRAKTTIPLLESVNVPTIPYLEYIDDKIDNERMLGFCWSVGGASRLESMSLGWRLRARGPLPPSLCRLSPVFATP